jgi:hypothetical protein
MDFESMLKELGNEWNVDLELDDEGNGVVGLKDGPDIIITGIPDEKPSPLCLRTSFPIPSGIDQEALFALLLEANLLGGGTDGAVFGLDTATDEIIMYRFVKGVDFIRTRKALESFAAHACVWQERIHQED